MIVGLCAASRVLHGAAGGRWQLLRRTALLTGVVIAALAVDTSIHPSGKSSYVSYKRGANRVRIHFISSLPRSGSTLLAARLCQIPRFRSGMSGPQAGMFGVLPGEMSARGEFAAFVDDTARQRVLHGRFDLHHADSPAAAIFDPFGSARAAMDMNLIAHNRVLQPSGQPEQRGTAVARQPKRAHQSHRTTLNSVYAPVVRGCTSFPPVARLGTTFRDSLRGTARLGPGESGSPGHQTITI